MSIEDNHDAYNGLRNMQLSLENRARSFYNYGYKDGFAKGVETATREIVEKIVAEHFESSEGENNDNPNQNRSE